MKSYGEMEQLIEDQQVEIIMLKLRLKQMKQTWLQKLLVIIHLTQVARAFRIPSF